MQGSQTRLRYLPRHSWYYRFQNMHFALGWSYPTIANAIGIHHSIILKCRKRARDKNQPLLHFEVIKKILEFEATYKDVIRKFISWPTLLDRTARPQRYAMVKLQPIKPRRPQDIAAMGVLETRRLVEIPQPEPESKFPSTYQREKRRKAYAQRSESITRRFAEKVAGGWSWHEAHHKAKPRRPDDAKESDGSVDQGIEIEKDVTKEKEK